MRSGTAVRTWQSNITGSNCIGYTVILSYAWQTSYGFEVADPGDFMKPFSYSYQTLYSDYWAPCTWTGEWLYPAATIWAYNIQPTTFVGSGYGVCGYVPPRRY